MEHWLRFPLLVIRKLHGLTQGKFWPPTVVALNDGNDLSRRFLSRSDYRYWPATRWLAFP